VFEKFSQWLRDIYTNLFDSPVKEMVSPAMRKVFDNLLSREGRQPQKKATTKPVAKPEGERVKKTFTTKRVYEGAFRDEVKDALEKTGLYRNIEKRSEAKKRALDFVEKVGAVAAMDAVRSGDVEGAARTYIANEALKDLQRQLDKAVADGDTELAKAIAQEYQGLVQERSAKLTSAGQESSALADAYQDPELAFNAAVMEQQWQSVSRTLTREQALELPDRQFIGKTITLSDKETKDYYTAKVARTTRTGELLDNPSLLLNYLRQTNTGSRLDALSDVLEDTEENIIVFYNYISEREAILKYIAKHHKNKKVLRYDGKQHDTLPKSDAQLKNIVLVAHYKSASTGLNLQWATVTVYFSLTYSYQEFEQSVGRTHRTGQSKKCVFYLFKAKNTVDDAIYQALRSKKDFSTALWASGLDNNE